MAWVVEDRATNWLRSMHPLLTPSENRIGNRVSTPGIPFGIHRKFRLPFSLSLPAPSSAKGAMVGREQFERPVLRSFPAGNLSFRIAWRWRADERRAFQFCAVEVIGCEHRVLRAGFTRHLAAACSRSLDFLPVRDMNDNDRVTDDSPGGEHDV